jgi:uncharacterized membrane protein YfcA
VSWTWISVAAIGLGIGFLGGLFGKGGSAVATPLLHLAGFPALIAVASPLPATIPATLSAADRYRRAGFLDRRVIGASVIAGVPATVLGSYASRWVGGDVLVKATEVMLVGIGIRLLLSHRVECGAPGDVDAEDGGDATGDDPTAAATADGLLAVAARPRVSRPVSPPLSQLLLVGLLAGAAAGLLANSGGFLLAPLYLGVVRMPIKPALGTSLAVSAVLAVPGTIVHAALGHIDWTVALVLAVCAIPASRLGATIALRTPPGRLERLFGAGLLTLGLALLVL